MADPLNGNGKKLWEWWNRASAVITPLVVILIFAFNVGIDRASVDSSVLANAREIERLKSADLSRIETDLNRVQRDYIQDREFRVWVRGVEARLEEMAEALQRLEARGGE